MSFCTAFEKNYSSLQKIIFKCVLRTRGAMLMQIVTLENIEFKKSGSDFTNSYVLPSDLEELEINFGFV
ncbi:MAG: hypothetical protein C5B52_05990 [Bacteroidetes bacterium]|nr:MAG: hypothetical protein C5B52_05990 [Bacteroidota bacterium]